MTRPKFANAAESSSRRSRRGNAEIPESAIPSDQGLKISEEGSSITDYMEQQKIAMMREPTRPITLRFEESLWQQIELLRGPLSKNDFFKFLVNYYARQKDLSK